MAESYLTNIDNVTAPRTVSRLGLAINDPAHCAAQEQSQVKSTIHYNEPDDPDNTKFMLLGMGNAGLRIFDVRNPAHPREVAYFNPGQIRLADGSTVLDEAFSHVHYHASTGHIWWPSRTGGFWVLELEPQVRKALGLPRKAARYPTGRPARPAGVASLVLPAADATAARFSFSC